MSFWLFTAEMIYRSAAIWIIFKDECMLNSMKSEFFKLKSEHIELNKLLKLIHIAQSGAHAKYMVENGEVKVNDQVESRKRAKLRPGDVIQVANRMIRIKASER